jgi:hypothetical protein
MESEAIDLISELKKISDDAQKTFGNLAPGQLNWKQSAESWSVGQCFDHLIKTNTPFFGDLDRIVAGEHKNPLWGKLPFLTDFWGRFILKAVAPENTKKSKNPKAFSPATSDVDANIIDKFVEHQRKVIEYVTATKNLDLTKIVVTSPVAPFVTYRLTDGYKIIVQHEKRHFRQAERVTQTEGFPAI